MDIFDEMKVDVEPEYIYMVLANEFNAELEKDLDELSDKYRHILLAPIARFKDGE